MGKLSARGPRNATSQMSPSAEDSVAAHLDFGHVNRLRSLSLLLDSRWEGVAVEGFFIIVGLLVVIAGFVYKLRR